MKPSQYLVAYKDNAKARTLYFGPFVSIDVASRFLADLPEPQPGGAKDYRTTQPFTANDTTLIQDYILSEREYHAA